MSRTSIRYFREVSLLQSITSSRDSALYHVLSGISDLGPKWLRLSPNGTNPGLFHIRLQYSLARRAKMRWNMIWKSLRYQFRANRTHFDPTPTSLCFMSLEYFYTSFFYDWLMPISSLIYGRHVLRRFFFLKKQQKTYTRVPLTCFSLF